MGSNDGEEDEEPVHTVYLDAYRIDKYEVTVADYKKCVDVGTCDKPKDKDDYEYCNWGYGGRGNHPINCVDWDDAEEYCKYVDKRLPTEAEWERAASWKNGQRSKYPSETDSVSCADAVMSDGGDGCGKDRTWEVGSKLAEINGTFDMAGNVSEWVSDWYDENYYKSDPSPKNNPKGPESGSKRVFRGGSWVGHAFNLRGANRYHVDPSFGFDGLGFRCALSP